MKVCANCRTEMQDDALWCPRCGADAGQAVDSPETMLRVEPDPAPMPASPAFCPSCGNPVAENSAFCSACGASLNANAVPQQQVVQRVVVVEKQREEPRRPSRPIIIPKEEHNTLGLISFILAMVGLFGFVITGWLGIGLVCIILWPITLILSFIALFKSPRGFAIAAFVISLLECIGMLITIIFFGALISALFS